jgi:hypothetical protein
MSVPTAKIEAAIAFWILTTRIFMPSLSNVEARASANNQRRNVTHIAMELTAYLRGGFHFGRLNREISCRPTKAYDIVRHDLGPTR